MLIQWLDIHLRTSMFKSSRFRLFSWSKLEKCANAGHFKSRNDNLKLGERLLEREILCSRKAKSKIIDYVLDLSTFLCECPFKLSIIFHADASSIKRWFSYIDDIKENHSFVGWHHHHLEITEYLGMNLIFVPLFFAAKWNTTKAKRNVFRQKTTSFCDKNATSF